MRDLIGLSCLAGMVLAALLGRRPREGLGRGSSVKKPPRPAAVRSDMERTALNLPLAPQTLAKPREGVFATHLTLYIGIVLVAALASYGFWLKNRSIFACQASGYSATRYLAYCGGGTIQTMSTARSSSISNLRLWSSPATPTCWCSETAASRLRSPTSRRRIGSPPPRRATT